MYPGNFDHLLLRRHIGPEVVHFDIYSIIERTKKIKDVDCISLIDALNNKAKVSNRINKSDLFICIKMFLALKQIVEDHKLDAVNVKCQYELSQEFGMTACLPISLMAEEGIVAACEGDIIITTSMVIFNYFTDQKIFYGDIVDIKDNVIWLSSCGAAPFSLADRSKDVFINNFDSFFEDLRGYKKAEPSLREVNPFRGLMNSFVLKPGELTVGCLIEGVGEYKFIAVRGLGLESELRQEFFPGIEIEIQGDMDRFIDNIPSQHFTFCYGDMIDPLKDLCGILGIEFLQF
jgi:L-fucose isomerase-like protein